MQVSQKHPAFFERRWIIVPIYSVSQQIASASHSSKVVFVVAFAFGIIVAFAGLDNYYSKKAGKTYTHVEHGWPWVFYRRTIEETNLDETESSFSTGIVPILNLNNWRIWHGVPEQPLRVCLLLANVFAVGVAASILGVASEIRTRYRGSFFRLTITDMLIVLVALSVAFGFLSHCKSRRSQEDKLVARLNSKSAWVTRGEVRWMEIAFGRTPDILSRPSRIDLLDASDGDIMEVFEVCEEFDAPLAISCQESKVVLSSLKDVGGLRTLSLHWSWQSRPTENRVSTEIIPILECLHQVTVFDLSRSSFNATDVDALRRARPDAIIINTE